MNEHKKINELLVDFALGELSQLQESEVRAHLTECHQCSSELKRLEALIECTENIKQLSADTQMCESAKDAILQTVESQELKQRAPGLNVGLEFMSRTIMKSKITKLAAAAVIIVVAILALQNGSIDLATIAFADISEAMKNVPWMHSVSRGFDETRKGVVELWIGFETKINASKDFDGKFIFWNVNEHRKYEYDPKSHSVTIEYASEDNVPLPLSSPVLLLERMQKMFKEQGAEIVTKSGEYMGQKAQIQEISGSFVNQGKQNYILRLFIEPESKLLFSAQVKSTDPNGNTLVDGETTFDYPRTGPKDIYDLGVPHDAKIISNLPEEDFQAVWDNYRQKRAEATKNYIAVITHARQSLGDVITMVDVDYKSNQNHRLERHFVFKTGQQINKFWPEYKQQLGNSFESLMAWTQAHYNNTGSISVYLYDGQYNLSTKRDNDGRWSKLRKDDSPGEESMPNIHLEYLAWPYIGKTGRVIEDDYAKQNNFICIERLQQGAVHSGSVTLPGRFLFYLDPQKNYLCRRKVMEWRPDAEWQEDKNWLEGIEPEKIRDASITVEDITNVTQAPNGHWYPEVIVVKQSGIRKDYNEEPLKVSGTKRIYIRTDPEFPNGIFETSNLIPAGAKIRKEGEKTPFEQTIAIIDSRPNWPEPQELVKRYWQARAAKNYDEMAILWPGSATWNQKLLADEKTAEYVFGETVFTQYGGAFVPYAEKTYYEKHGKYNLKMWLRNEKSTKGRYYIVSGN